MANNLWSNYTEKTTALSDNDEVMLLDSTDSKNKRGLMSRFWDYVVDKMATAVISKLETDNKTIIGAINALNGNSFTGKTIKWLGTSAPDATGDGASPASGTIILNDSVKNYNFVMVISAFYHDSPTAVYGISLIPVSLYLTFRESIFYPVRRTNDDLVFDSYTRRNDTEIEFNCHSTTPMTVYGFK